MKISLQQARDVAALAVEERGSDYVDEYDHLYFNFQDSPSCLVGWVLNYVGIDKKAIYVNNLNGAHLATLAGYLLDIDEDTENYLTVLQHDNDEGCTWGEALGHAEALHGKAEVVEAQAPESQLV